MTGVGILGGVALTKFLPTLVPATMQIGGQFGRVIFSAVATAAAGFAASKLGLPAPLVTGVYAGGAAQTISVALNTFLPSFASNIVPAGFGYLQPGSFVVPQNPLRALPAPATTNARITVNGLQRAFGVAI